MSTFDGYEEGSGHARMNMEDEYEGGQWIDGEFYYAKKREKFSQSKVKPAHYNIANFTRNDIPNRKTRTRLTECSIIFISTPFPTG